MSRARRPVRVNLTRSPEEARPFLAPPPPPAEELPATYLAAPPGTTPAVSQQVVSEFRKLFGASDRRRVPNSSNAAKRERAMILSGLRAESGAADISLSPEDADTLAAGEEARATPAAARTAAQAAAIAAADAVRASFEQQLREQSIDGRLTPAERSQLVVGMLQLQAAQRQLGATNRNRASTEAAINNVRDAVTEVSQAIGPLGAAPGAATLRQQLEALNATTTGVVNNTATIGDMRTDVGRVLQQLSPANPTGFAGQNVAALGQLSADITGVAAQLAGQNAQQAAFNTAVTSAMQQQLAALQSQPAPAPVVATTTPQPPTVQGLQTLAQQQAGPVPTNTPPASTPSTPDAFSTPGPVGGPDSAMGSSAASVAAAASAPPGLDASKLSFVDALLKSSVGDVRTALLTNDNRTEAGVTPPAEQFIRTLGGKKSFNDAAFTRELNKYPEGSPQREEFLRGMAGFAQLAIAYNATNPKTRVTIPTNTLATLKSVDPSLEGQSGRGLEIGDDPEEEPKDPKKAILADIAAEFEQRGRHAAAKLARQHKRQLGVDTYARLLRTLGV